MKHWLRQINLSRLPQEEALWMRGGVLGFYAYTDAQNRLCGPAYLSLRLRLLRLLRKSIHFWGFRTIHQACHFLYDNTRLLYPYPFSFFNFISRICRYDKSFFARAMFYDDTIKPLYLAAAEINIAVHRAFMDFIRIFQNLFYYVFLIPHAGMFDIYNIFPICRGNANSIPQGSNCCKQYFHILNMYSIEIRKSQFSFGEYNVYEEAGEYDLNFTVDDRR